MNKQPKKKRCLVCREPFTPRRIGNTMRMTKHCGNSACELDLAQRNVKQAKPKPKKPKTVAALKKEYRLS